MSSFSFSREVWNSVREGSSVKVQEYSVYAYDAFRNPWNIFNFIQFKIKNPIYYMAIFMDYIFLHKNNFMQS